MSPLQQNLSKQEKKLLFCILGQINVDVETISLNLNQVAL